MKALDAGSTPWDLEPRPFRRPSAAGFAMFALIRPLLVITATAEVCDEGAVHRIVVSGFRPNAFSRDSGGPDMKVKCSGPPQPGDPHFVFTGHRLELVGSRVNRYYHVVQGNLV